MLFTLSYVPSHPLPLSYPPFLHLTPPFSHLPSYPIFFDVIQPSIQPSIHPLILPLQPFHPTPPHHTTPHPHSQVRMQEELKKRTEKGEYSAMFSIIKDGAMMAKRDLDAENRRFMIVHGQVRTQHFMIDYM